MFSLYKNLKTWFHFILEQPNIGQLRVLMVITCLLFPFTLQAQKTKKVEGTYTYHTPENCSIEEAKRIALERAKIQALADAFGTIISQSNATRIHNENGHTSSHFLSIGNSEVKGEWIETIGTPEFKVETFSQNILVTVHIKGIAREITEQKAEITARILRNGTDDKFEDDQFRNGDDLFLSFQSPIEGYLTVYLIDAQPRAYCLLPYRGQTDGIYHIEANKHYVFFSKKVAELKERHLVDEYVMTCDKSTEHNQIYIVFSPTPFVKATDNSVSSSLPRELEYNDFQKWLAKYKRTDVKLINKTIPIVIIK